jgi:hypothetical protein
MIDKIEISDNKDFNYIINDELYFSIVDFNEDLIVDYRSKKYNETEVKKMMVELLEKLMQAVENGSIQI